MKVNQPTPGWDTLKQMYTTKCPVNSISTLTALLQPTGDHVPNPFSRSGCLGPSYDIENYERLFSIKIVRGSFTSLMFILGFGRNLCWIGSYPELCLRLHFASIHAKSTRLCGEEQWTAMEKQRSLSFKRAQTIPLHCRNADFVLHKGRLPALIPFVTSTRPKSYRHIPVSNSHSSCLDQPDP